MVIFLITWLQKRIMSLSCGLICPVTVTVPHSRFSIWGGLIIGQDLDNHTVCLRKHWSMLTGPHREGPLIIARCHTKEEYELNPHLTEIHVTAPQLWGGMEIILWWGHRHLQWKLSNVLSKLRYQQNRLLVQKVWWMNGCLQSGGNMDFPLLRYAEVLLTYAEAKIMH